MPYILHVCATSTLPQLLRAESGIVRFKLNSVAIATFNQYNCLNNLYVPVTLLVEFVIW